MKSVKEAEEHAKLHHTKHRKRKLCGARKKVLKPCGSSAKKSGETTHQNHANEEANAHEHAHEHVHDHSHEATEHTHEHDHEHEHAHEHEHEHEEHEHDHDHHEEHSESNKSYGTEDLDKTPNLTSQAFGKKSLRLRKD